MLTTTPTRLSQLQEQAKLRQRSPVTTLRNQLKQARKEVTQREKVLFEFKALHIKQIANQI